MRIDQRDRAYDLDNEVKDSIGGDEDSSALANSIRGYRDRIVDRCDKLGITDEEFEDYYKKVEEIKTNVREQNKIHEGGY